MHSARGEMLSIDDLLKILATPLLGIVPESEGVLRRSDVGCAVREFSPSVRACANRFQKRSWSTWIGESMSRRSRSLSNCRTAPIAALPERADVPREVSN